MRTEQALSALTGSSERSSRPEHHPTIPPDRPTPAEARLGAASGLPGSQSADLHRTAGAGPKSDTIREGARSTLGALAELLLRSSRAPGTPLAPLAPPPPHPTANAASRGPTARLHGGKRAQRSGVECYERAVRAVSSRAGARAHLRNASSGRPAAPGPPGSEPRRLQRC